MTIARLAQGGRWRVEAMRGYTQDVLLWFTKGQGRITIAGRTRGYSANSAFFIPAGTMHGFEAGPQVYGFALFLSRSLGISFFKEMQHLKIPNLHSQAELTNLIEHIQREFDQKGENWETAALHHIGLVSVTLARAKTAQIETSQSSNKTLELTARYTQMIEEQFRSGRRVSDYAKALDITPTHLSRICNKACGRSASALLSERIIYEAQRLLSETKLPVQKVSEQLGFTSPAYFSRSFQIHTGMSPTAFRKII